VLFRRLWKWSVIQVLMCWHELSFDSIRLSLCKATLEIIEQQSAVVGKRPV
jgi:hypothetical protein